MVRRAQWVATILCLLGCPTALIFASQSGPQPSDQGSIQADIERIVGSYSDVIGVTAYHVESGQTVSVRGGELFPMASVYKVPIALQFLHLADLNQISLDESIIVLPSDLQPGHSRLPRRIRNGVASLPLRELVQLMLVDSDNTASDLILRRAGGPAAVTKRMLALGVSGIHVDRSVVEMTLDENGVATPPPAELWTRETIRQVLADVTPTEQTLARARFVADPRDSATPSAMVHVLYLIYRRMALLQPNADWLVQLMEQSETGSSRLKGLIPKDTTVAHKTGTLDCCVNDAGIITLPNDKGHILIAVFIKGRGRMGMQRQRAIAEISRAAYEGWSGEKLPRLKPNSIRRVRLGGGSRKASTTGRPSRRSRASMRDTARRFPARPANSTP